MKGSLMHMSHVIDFSLGYNPGTSKGNGKTWWCPVDNFKQGRGKLNKTKFPG